MNGTPDHQRFGSIEAARRAWGDLGPEAEALVAACLVAMAADERHPTPLNAIRWINPRALDEARAVDRQGLDPARLLHGIPVVLKDNIDMLGAPTTSGSIAMAGAMPRGDAGVVRRLREAGAIIVAKTNLSEFSFEIRSRSSLGGDVLNPFDRAVTSGGSSGGAAVAVAAGFALAAVGTDTGGSVRTPAAFNGLVGLRPSHGLVDLTGVAPLAPSTDTVGVMTRSVSDARTLLGVLAGGGMDLSPMATRLRLGVFRQAFGTDPVVTAAGETVLRGLADLGVVIVDPVLLPEVLLDFTGEHIVDWEFGRAFDGYLATNFVSGAPTSLAAILASGEFLPEYRETLARRSSLGAGDDRVHQAILASHARLADGLAALFESHDLDAIVYPTSMTVPTSLQNPKGGWGPELAARSGRPAITLPVAQAESGIPIGLELLGKRGEEVALLNLASTLERSIGQRFWPPLG